jgi:hypothetical protein
MFQNGVLRKVFGAKREERIGDWDKLHNQELHDLYSLSDIIRVIKSRRMRWTGLLIHTGKKQSVYRVWLGNMKEVGDFKNVDIHWRIIIKLIVTALRWEDMDFIHLAEDRYKLWALVKVVMNYLEP